MGGDTPILVYFGGKQMCYPTTTCFVANLKPGNYTIEVYASVLPSGENAFGKEKDCIMNVFTLTEMGT